MSAAFPDGLDPQGTVIAARGDGDELGPVALSDSALKALQDISADGEVHSVDIPGLGDY